AALPSMDAPTTRTAPENRNALKLLGLRIHKPGSLWMLVAALFFAIMGTLVKIGGEKFSSPELVFYRSFFGLVFIFVLARRNQLQLQSPVLGRLLTGSILSLVSLVIFFSAISQLPLATGITLNYSAPLSKAAFAPFMLRRRARSIL